MPDAIKTWHYHIVHSQYWIMEDIYFYYKICEVVAHHNAITLNVAKQHLKV